MRIISKSKASLGIALLFLFTGCHFQRDQVKGSGVRQKQKRDVESFTSIATEGAFDIEVVCQKTPSLEIEADDNILPLITTEVSRNVLHIKSRRSFSISDPIKLKIAVANLDGLSVSGAGKIEVAGIKNDQFEIDANGATTIRLAGETKVLDIDTNGAGKIDAHRLKADRGVIEAKGVARVDVNVSQKLEVTVSGPARVTYVGDPVVEKTVNGPGSVERREVEGN